MAVSAASPTHTLAHLHVDEQLRAECARRDVAGLGRSLRCYDNSAAAAVRALSVRGMLVLDVGRRRRHGVTARCPLPDRRGVYL